MRAPRGLFYGRRKREAFEVAWRAMRFGDGLAARSPPSCTAFAAAVPRRWGSSRNLAPCSRPRPTCGSANRALFPLHRRVLGAVKTFPHNRCNIDIALSDPGPLRFLSLRKAETVAVASFDPITFKPHPLNLSAVGSNKPPDRGRVEYRAALQVWDRFSHEA
jgi:hypothetical protein